MATCVVLISLDENFDQDDSPLLFSEFCSSPEVKFNVSDKAYGPLAVLCYIVRSLNISSYIYLCTYFVN